MKQNLVYDIYGAAMHGEHRHPDAVLKDLGIIAYHSKAMPIAQAWFLWACSDVPEALPPYISTNKCSPQQAVGYGLDQETADRINAELKAQP